MTKKIFYTALLVVLILLMVEIITSVFYYHRYGKRTLAVVELYHAVKENLRKQREVENRTKQNYQFQQLVRPDSSEQMNRQVHDEAMASNQLVYTPWLEFRNKDFTGTYVNIRGFERKTIPGFIQKGKDTLIIWFLGGSTTFGFNVADAETIPSFFARQFYDSIDTNTSLEVHNYGVPYYYLYQEYKLFQHLLNSQKKPDLVIFIDGLNNFVYKNYTAANESWLSNTYRNTTPLATLTTVTEYPTDKTLLINSYLQSVSLIEQEAAVKDIHSLLVVQPVPYYQYPDRASDLVCSKKEEPLFVAAYPQLETAFLNKTGRLYLGDIQKQAIKPLYVDAFHYSPGFNQQIASLILQRVKLLMQQKL
ncbi:MAG: SGNH/GDSL hydrolase family protein [Lacibacter sp.]|jgi:hypothetical protein